MPNQDYIPAEDESFRTYAEHFVAVLLVQYAQYGFTLPQAQFLDGLVQDFVDKLAIALAEDTRTKPTIAAKTASRATCETLLRQYAMQIKENEGIPDADKIAIGVRPINTNREPIECPQNPPIVSIIGATNGAQTLRYSDSATPDSRAKPFGATCLQLYVAITDNEDAPFSDAVFYGTFTTNPVVVHFSPEHSGKAATYYARWQSQRGDTGLWSVPVSMRIAA